MRIGEKGTEVVDDVAGVYEEYGAGEEMPLAGYAALMAVFVTGVGLATAAARRKRQKAGVVWRLLGRGREEPRVAAADVALLGIATHKLTRIITKDWVTAPVRAPFTEYKGSSGFGEVKERARGRGLQRAVGDLLTCQFCMGPWVAGALTLGLVFVPRFTRMAGAALAMVTVSDWLHVLYERYRQERRVVDAKGDGRVGG